MDDDRAWKTRAADPDPTSPPPQSSSNKSKLTIILVSCIGGFVLVLVVVLLVVPYARRYLARPLVSSKQVDGVSDRGSARSHQRSASGLESSMPLLVSDNAELDPRLAQASETKSPNGYDGDSFLGARLFTATDNPYSVRPHASTPRIISAQPPLRRARTRVTQLQPMDTLPEDTAIVPALSPPVSSDEHPSWLHVPNPVRRPSGNLPLIGAFRSSVSSTTSTNSRLASLQHYPSFNASAPSAKSLSTFYSLSSLADSATTKESTRVPPLPSEYGEILPPAARLKPSGGPERRAQVQQVVDVHPASRQASFLNGRASDYPTSASASTVSVYTDARSRLGDDESEAGGTMRSR
ncbi:hypothetical protein FA95DRAFT_1570355 [Auriscalpium vulgare]|uniref:Uncharacterized protein n=1 Tax=Auriscalpium vulgare TaxID=40419 RepID=A0ACB8S3Y5_9AGAM|nr:hypothetical protein FA95DRAFT_1570355 [Auriscalpium vulgare]